MSSDPGEFDLSMAITAAAAETDEAMESLGIQGYAVITASGSLCVGGSLPPEIVYHALLDAARGIRQGLADGAIPVDLRQPDE